jgi:protein SCO1
MLRTSHGFDAVRRHFHLGVNFIESLVNRHRIEVFVLDAAGRIAATFQRIHWDEQEVVNRTLGILQEERQATSGDPEEPSSHPTGRKGTLPMFGVFASAAVAFFPKCPICWAAYLSVFGIAGLNQIPYSPWLRPVLVLVMLINLASAWLRAHVTRRMSGFYLVTAGALAILVSQIISGGEWAAPWGVALTFAGSLLSVLSATNAGNSISKRLHQVRQAIL